MKQLYLRWWRSLYARITLRQLIWVSFTLTSLLGVGLFGLTFYGRYSSQLQETIIEENKNLMEQVANTCSSYVHRMMKVSDSLYYTAIRRVDANQAMLNASFQLLYDTNKDEIESIALFSIQGDLLASAPAATLRDGFEARQQLWFRAALAQRENLLFSPLQVSNAFASQGGSYTWVVPMSRVVQVQTETGQQAGILLIQLRHSALEDIFSNVLLGEDAYVYLIDRNGNLLYHPLQQLLSSGEIQENNQKAASYRDGNWVEEFQGQKRDVLVKSIGYTGWKIVGVIPQNDISLTTVKSVLFALFLGLFFLTALAALYGLISRRVTEPLLHLEAEVKELEEGKWDTEVAVEGFAEVRHLGSALNHLVQYIRRLMEDIVKEHEAKRRSEILVLQNQINPHFLYNTLDIIVWMIENEKKTEAVRVVTALARFFRISLSKGKNIIRVCDEVEHVRSYLTIQEMRYKNKFQYRFDVAEETMELGVPKLVLQPLVENAIYHAMEFMDGDGEIVVRGHVAKQTLVLAVEDNGCGMTPEMTEALLAGNIQSKKGSGVGVKNVQERLQLLFGKAYGLFIQSEPDEGTIVEIRLPAMPYEELAKREGER